MPLVAGHGQQVQATGADASGGSGKSIEHRVHLAPNQIGVPRSCLGASLKAEICR